MEENFEEKIRKMFEEFCKILEIPDFEKNIEKLVIYLMTDGTRTVSYTHLTLPTTERV